jgi:hypothetical protein
MGQNIDGCVVLEQSKQKSNDKKNEVKTKTPFSKLPDKAVFNYIRPINYHD